MHPLLFITFDPWSEYVKNNIFKIFQGQGRIEKTEIIEMAIKHII